jgi:AraC family transcriptional regulator
VHQERAVLVVDRRHRPIEIGTFRWSSADTRWRGLPVESRLLASSGELDEYGVDHVLLGVCVGGIGTLKVRDGRNTRSLTSSPGRFSLVGRGFDQKPVSWSGSRDMIFVAIGSDQLIGLTGGDANPACLNVAPQFAVSDPNVGSLVLNMRDEIQAGCPSGKLYAEALSLALAAYLFKRYSIDMRPECGDATALSSRQLARVREYIRANLANDIGLCDLADQLDLSPHYFATLFKRAVGVPPHRYLLQERITEAKRLLAARRMSISEVAMGLGFSDQSHFSHAFRKIVGTTPKRYQGTY